MIPQTDKSWPDYRALNQNWSYQPTLAGHAINIIVLLLFENVKLTVPRLGQKQFICIICDVFYDWVAMEP